MPPHGTVSTVLLLDAFEPRSEVAIAESLATQLNQTTREETNPNLSASPSQRKLSNRNPLQSLAARVASKLEEGDFNGAIRLASSEDTIAELNDRTLTALKEKHPPPHPDSNIPTAPFVNLVLEGKTPAPVRPFFFGASLVALDKKDGGVRPIATGWFLRRLAAKSPGNCVMETMRAFLTPLQLGYETAHGSEAAAHAAVSIYKISQVIICF